MKGLDQIEVSLSVEDWRGVYRILKDDGPWQRELILLKEYCQHPEATVPLTVAQTWTMAATVRESDDALAEKLKEQLSLQTALLAFKEDDDA